MKVLDTCVVLSMRQVYPSLSLPSYSRVLSEPVQNFLKKKVKKKNKTVREDAKNRGVETTRLKF